MTVKISIEADNPMELLRILDAVAESPSQRDTEPAPLCMELDGPLTERQAAYQGVTDLAAALKESLPADVEELREQIGKVEAALSRVRDKLDQRIENVIGTVNDLSLKSDIGCKHDPVIITCDTDGKPYNGNGAFMKLVSWEGWVSDEDKKAGKQPPTHYYRINGEANDLSIFLCRKCNRLYVVATKVEEDEALERG